MCVIFWVEPWLVCVGASYTCPHPNQLSVFKYGAFLEARAPAIESFRVTCKSTEIEECWVDQWYRMEAVLIWKFSYICQMHCKESIFTWLEIPGFPVFSCTLKSWVEPRDEADYTNIIAWTMLRAFDLYGLCGTKIFLITGKRVVSCMDNRRCNTRYVVLAIALHYCYKQLVLWLQEKGEPWSFPILVLLRFRLTQTSMMQ